MVFKSPSEPSIKINGVPLEPSPMVVVPRTFTLGVASIEPDELEICKPGTRPCNAWVALATGREAISLLSITETAPVRFTFF